MLFNRQVRVQCKCGNHIFPEQSDVVDSMFGDDSEDWWVEEKCKTCGDTCMFGGEVVAGTLNHNRGDRSILHPEYV